MANSVRRRSWTTRKGETRTAWIADYTDPQGVRRQETFKLQSEAKERLADARVQARRGTYTPDATPVTIDEALELWLDRAAAEGLERSTREQYRQHRDHILQLIDGKLKLSKLSTARCERLRDDLVREHSRATARKILVSFKAMLRDARRRGFAGNPAAETMIERQKRGKRKLQAGRDFPMPAQVMAMIDQAGRKARALVCLAALAGLRASELRGLAWEALELSGRAPLVRVSRRADRWNTLGSPKSEEGQRDVPLGELSMRALKEWKLAQPPGRTLVFGTASDRPDTLVNLTNRLLIPLEKAAGVPHYGWHALRHYAISTWLKTCRGDFKKVQIWAGHGTLAMTLDTYGHLIEDADDHARIADAEAVLRS